MKILTYMRCHTAGRLDPQLEALLYPKSTDWSLGGIDGADLSEVAL